MLENNITQNKPTVNPTRNIKNLYFNFKKKRHDNSPHNPSKIKLGTCEYKTMLEQPNKNAKINRYIMKSIEKVLMKVPRLIRGTADNKIKE